MSVTEWDTSKCFHGYLAGNLFFIYGDLNEGVILY